METILVSRAKPRRDPNRPAGTLLLAQVHHLHEAEKDLPPNYRSGIFHKAIQTEAEAARYIRAVTEMIHKAHDDAAAERAKPVRRRDVLEIAAGAADAVAGEAPIAPGANKSQAKKKSGKGGRKS